jgi:PKD repeat protein
VAAPVAKFDSDFRDGSKDVNFTDKSSGQITSWSWDFGDATQSSQQNPPSHPYDNYQTYHVVLTVSGPGGTDSRSHDITLAPAATPTPVITPSPTEPVITPCPDPSPPEGC